MPSTGRSSTYNSVGSRGYRGHSSSSSKPTYSTPSYKSSNSNNSYKSNDNSKDKKIPPGPTPSPSQVPSQGLGQVPIQGGFLSTMMNGFSFGAGSSIAHRIFGPKPEIQVNTTTKQPIDNCKELYSKFSDCLTMEKSNCEVNYDKFEDYEKCMEIKNNGCDSFKRAYDTCYYSSEGRLKA